MSHKVENVGMVTTIAETMGDLTDAVVFLGGTILPFLLKPPFDDCVRRAKDVDFIIDFDRKDDLFAFEDQMWEQGFKKTGNGAVCRWNLGPIHIDALPGNPDVLTFNNQWCGEAMRHAKRIKIGEWASGNIISAPYYLGTKLNAFDRRGKGDYAQSPDIFDLMLIFAGHEGIEAEIRVESTETFRAFVSEALGVLLEETKGLQEMASLYRQDHPEVHRVFPEIKARLEAVCDLSLSMQH